MRLTEGCAEESGDDGGDLDGCADSWAITALPRENAEESQTRPDRVDSRASARAPHDTPAPPSSVPVSAAAAPPARLTKCCFPQGKAPAVEIDIRHSERRELWSTRGTYVCGCWFELWLRKRRMKYVHVNVSTLQWKFKNS